MPLASLVGAAGSALGSAAAGICCLGPIGISLLGVQGAIFAAGLKPYSGYLLTGSAVLLGIAFWSVYRRPKNRRTNGQSCPSRGGRWTKRILWTSAAVWMGAAVLQFLSPRLWL